MKTMHNQQPGTSTPCQITIPINTGPTQPYMVGIPPAALLLTNQLAKKNNTGHFVRYLSGISSFRIYLYSNNPQDSPGEASHHKHMLSYP